MRVARHLLLASSACLLTMMTVVPADAEDRADKIESDASDIVITAQRAGVLQLGQPADGASRLGLTPMETPASVDVITKEMIRSLGDRTVVGAAARAPGLINNSSAFGYSLSSRGFTGYTSVMQLYDGMRVYTTTTQTFPADPWMAERIEVLRGAASVLYGEGGIGGAINVVRKKTNTEHLEGEIRLSAGSFDTYAVAGGVGGPISDTLSYRVDASYNRSQGWMDRGQSRSLALSGALRYRPTETLVITLTHDRADTDPTIWYGTPLRDGVLVPEIRKKNYNIGDRSLRFDDAWTQLKVEWNPNEAISITNVAYYLTGYKHWRNAEGYAWSGNQIRRSSYLEIFYDTKQFGDRFNAVFEHKLFGIDHRFSIGWEYNIGSLDRIDSSPNTRFDLIDPYNFQPGSFLDGAFGTRYKYYTDVEQVAVFGESRLSFTDSLSLITGLRYDRPQTKRYDALDRTQNYKATYPSTSWRAGLVYNPSKNISLYGQFSAAADPVTAFLTATLAQTSFDVSTGRQWEAGVKANFLGGRGEFTLSGYKITKKKLLTRSANDPTISVQVGQQSSYGLEASFGLAVTKTFSILANGTVLNAEYDDFTELVGTTLVSRNGNMPIGVAEKAANLWLSWAPIKAFHLDGGLRYVGERYSDAANTRRIPAYALVDVSARYDLGKKTSVTVNLRNVLDKIYAQNSYSTSQWVLGEPRSVAVTFEQRF
jgi:iron complex outermembrane receptor protein